MLIHSIRGFENYFLKLVPFNDNYLHSTEGYDDMPAHIKTSLTNTNITLSVIDKKLKLGTWKAYFYLSIELLLKSDL